MTWMKTYRTVVLINLLLIFVQFSFAGQMLAGSNTAVRLHGFTGVLLVLIALVQAALSIGLKVKEDGTVVDVAYGGPAKKAGIAPAVKLIAVNNRQFTTEVLRVAVQRTASGGPLELLVKSGEYYEVHRVDYHGGESFPHLERDRSKADLLSAIVAPMAAR